MDKHLGHDHVPAANPNSKNHLVDGRQFPLADLPAAVDNRRYRKSAVVETRAHILAPLEHAWDRLIDMKATASVTAEFATSDALPTLNPLADDYRDLGEVQLTLLPKWVRKRLGLRGIMDVQTLAEAKWFYARTRIVDGKGRVWLTERCESYMARLPDGTTAYYMTDYMIGNPVFVAFAMLRLGGFRSFKRSVYTIVQRLADYFEASNPR